MLDIKSPIILLVFVIRLEYSNLLREVNQTLTFASYLIE